MTIENLSRRSGVPAGDIRDLEGELADVPMQTIAALADALETSPGELIRGEAATTAPLFRASGAGDVSDASIAIADRVIDDFFAFEALARR